MEHFYVGGFGSEAHAFRSITSLAKTKPKSAPEELWAKRVKGHKLRSDRHTYENDTVVVPFKKGLFTPAGRAYRSSKIIEVQKNGAIESGTHGGPPPPPPPPPPPIPSTHPPLSPGAPRRSCSTFTPRPLPSHVPLHSRSSLSWARRAAGTYGHHTKKEIADDTVTADSQRVRKYLDWTPPAGVNNDELVKAAEGVYTSPLMLEISRHQLLGYITMTEVGADDTGASLTNAMLEVQMANKMPWVGFVHSHPEEVWETVTVRVTAFCHSASFCLLLPVSNILAVVEAKGLLVLIKSLTSRRFAWLLLPPPLCRTRPWRK